MIALRLPVVLSSLLFVACDGQPSVPASDVRPTSEPRPAAESPASTERPAAAPGTETPTTDPLPPGPPVGADGGDAAGIRPAPGAEPNPSSGAAKKRPKTNGGDPRTDDPPPSSPGDEDVPGPPGGGIPSGMKVADPAIKAKVQAKYGPHCRAERVCRDMLGIDCNAAADGPYFYVSLETFDELAKCGGACMMGDCKNCPPKNWDCPTY